ncbi:hypothetical protein HPT27_06490 [Permianibacter sp. IMCC34836]|uniref:beta strand repeat-containing protein n=1 Tax=Permianibacter fluminis TaxID=2738515 RepID=UPI001556BC38|nr:Ig-like domain-containing protein [Permianibacter fluminis]NQD36667.1 hypothetical protein [Permianibacter fluminis]
MPSGQPRSIAQGGGRSRLISLCALLIGLLLIIAMPAPVHAAGAADATYNGTDGTANNVFASCTGCHSAGGGQTPFLDSYAAVTANFTPVSGTGIGSCGGSSQPVYQCAKTLIDANLMPFACTPGVDCLTASQKSLLTSWIADSRPLQSAPFVQTPTSSAIGKYSVTLNTNVSENGAESSFSFHYKKSSAGGYTTATVTGTEEGDFSTDSDGNGASKAISKTISLSGAGNCGTTYNFFAQGVNAVNTTTSANGSNFNTLACPSISNIADRSINEDSSTGAVAFTLADGSSTCGLSLGASSSNTTLIPNGSLVFGGSCAARTITATPAANQFGSSTITVTVSDGTTTDTDTYVVTVNSVNDAPSISDISDQGTSEDTPLGPIAFSISDIETAAGSLVVSASSSNQTLIPNANISFGGSGGSRTLSLTPALDQTGSATITVSVFDGVDTSSDTFVVLVSAVNDNPTISNISNQSSNEDNSNTVSFTVADNETAAGSLTVSATSSNTALVPNSNLVFGGSGANRNLTATPLANQNGSSTITVTVRDAQLAAASDVYVLTIVAINDAPSLATISSQTVTELSPFALAASVTDPDDNNDGSGALTFSLPVAPAGMTIGATGIINWTPGQHTDGSYPVTVRVVDGGENGAGPATSSFTITVQKLDGDADTIADYDDNCPLLANTNQADNDVDNSGDACDEDDDNDGLPDSIELARGLDPFDPADANADLDGDGLSNLAEYLNCVANADPVCDAIAVDSVAPVITTNGDLTVNATGYLTDAGETASAEDGVDGTVAVTADVHGPFRPGLYTITWTAQDAVGNTATSEQIIRVLPRAEIVHALQVGEGQIVDLAVQLNGEAPEYPVLLVYNVAGSASSSDHNLANGTVTISSGQLGNIQFTTTADAAPEADETIVVTLTSSTANATLGDSRQATITIVDRPVPPEVRLQAEQAGDPTQIIYTDLGLLSVRALATDANANTLTYEWQVSDDSISSNAAGNLLTIDPSALATGTFAVTVVVSDGSHQVTQSLSIRVAGVAPVLLDSNDSDGDGLDDLAEGLADSDGDGSSDYRDPVDARNLLVINANAADRMSRLISTDPGLQLRLGERALTAQRQGARLLSTEITDSNGDVISDADYAPLGELYDFELVGLSDTQRYARVIIPLAINIPPQAVYRKLIAGSWRSFRVADGDEIASALMVDGRCPALDANSWHSGLNTGEQCLRLTILDGGSNDADGIVNGVVADPGGIAIARSTPADSPPDDGPNGGGGPAAIALLLVSASLMIIRRRRGRHSA